MFKRGPNLRTIIISMFLGGAIVLLTILIWTDQLLEPPSFFWILIYRGLFLAAAITSGFHGGGGIKFHLIMHSTNFLLYAGLGFLLLWSLKRKCKD